MTAGDGRKDLVSEDAEPEIDSETYHTEYYPSQGPEHQTEESQSNDCYEASSDTAVDGP
jgi:hypothetical protein